MRRQYTTPNVIDIGSIAEMTGQNFNKINSAQDAASQTIPSIVGSLTPI